MIQHTHSGRFIRSGRKQPCPICGRTKDQDCSWKADFSVIFCHHPRTDLKPGRDLIGDFVFIKNTSDYRAAMFVLNTQRSWS